MPLAKLANKIYPSFKIAPFPVKKSEVKRRHLEEFQNDPLLEFSRISVRNILLNEEIMKKFHEKEIDKVTLPFIMILGG